MSKKSHVGRTRPLKFNAPPPKPPSEEPLMRPIHILGGNTRTASSQKHPTGHSGKTDSSARISIGYGMEEDKNRAGSLVEYRTLTGKQKYKKK
jgi:hypothetical protein